MSIATIVLSVDSPLGDYTLAGQSALGYLQSATGPFAFRFIEAAGLDQELGARLQTWLAEGLQRVLLLRTDRPLVTTAALAPLLEDQSASLVLLRAPDGQLAAACSDAGWLWGEIASSALPLSLDDLARRPAARALSPADPLTCLAVDALPALAEAERIVWQRINLHWMQAGVRIVDPATTYIDAAVTIGKGTVILPNTHLWGRTSIGEASCIGPNSIVRDSEIGDRCEVTASMVEDAVMEHESDVGPFGHMRKGARLCRGAHMGNFGEIKNSTLGPNAKMGHLAYLGDATVGEDVNIGAGTITCNYDGVNKHKTIIQEGAFIGSDTMLVAPVEIGAGARIGAGSVVTHDIPPGAVAFGVPARVKRMIEEQEGENSEPSK